MTTLIATAWTPRDRSARAPGWSRAAGVLHYYAVIGPSDVPRRGDMRSLAMRCLIAALDGLGLLRPGLKLFAFRKAIGPSGRVIAWRRAGCRIQGDVRLGPRVTMRRPENVSIGDGTVINGPALIDAWGPITIGRRCILGGQIELLSGSHDVDGPDLDGKVKPIDIGDYAWLPRHVIVLPGVVIGTAAVVGTGAVVSRDVPDYAVAAGNPARVVRTRARQDFRYVPTQM
jgi:acetyltransferase-like isoleucine patch superfamily enzyme